MHTQISTARFHLQKMGSYLFNIGLLAGLATLTFGLVSCGGGGGTSTTAIANTTMTVTGISPLGIVASSVEQTVYILGTNFASGVSVSITNSSGTPAVNSLVIAPSGNAITAKIKIDTAPTNRYVTLKVQPSTGTSVSAILGVASVSKTFAADISSILSTPASAVSCTGCHSGTTPTGGLDLTNANNLINQPSQGCSQKFRVVPGDPRRSSSVLIDKIEATSAVPACSGASMPNGSTSLIPAEIQDIVEWVAGGAN